MSQELRVGDVSKAIVKYYVLRKVAGIAVTPSIFNECYQRVKYTLRPFGRNIKYKKEVIPVLDKMVI